MSRRFLFLLMAAVIGTGFATAAEPVATNRQAAQKSAAAEAARLVKELASEDFDTRERAARQLEALGPAVGPALQKAVASADPEVRRLALQVAERLARKVEAVEVLEPKRLRIAFRDMPLNMAIQYFTQATGARIQLEGVKGDRKITLDTEYTGFWDAFDKFCAAAGLVEKIYDTPIAGDTQNEMYPGGGPWGRRRMMIMMRNGAWAPQQDDIIPALHGGQFVLVEGKAARRPTYQAGAVRFRALPAGTLLGKISSLKGDRELIFGLEILPEPTMAWEKVQSLHIGRAIDDLGQSLQITQPHISEAPSENEEMMWWGGYDPGNSNANNGGQRVPLRLVLGRKPSAVLKELSGVATIKLQTATQTIAAVDRILEAKEKAVKGTDGSFLKVVEVKPEEGGRLMIHVKVEQAPDENANVNPWGWGWGARMWRGMNDGSETVDSSVSTGNLVLFDARGNLVRLVAKEPIPDDNGVNEEYRFVYQVLKGQPEPARLVLQGRRPVTIDVPFTLRDVPLRPSPGAAKAVPPPAQPSTQGPESDVIDLIK
jgi:hypothetical protein